MVVTLLWCGRRGQKCFGHFLICTYYSACFFLLKIVQRFLSYCVVVPLAKGSKTWQNGIWDLGFLRWIRQIWWLKQNYRSGQESLAWAYREWYADCISMEDPPSRMITSKYDKIWPKPLEFGPRESSNLRESGWAEQEASRIWAVMNLSTTAGLALWHCGHCDPDSGAHRLAAMLCNVQCKCEVKQSDLIFASEDYLNEW